MEDSQTGKWQRNLAAFLCSRKTGRFTTLRNYRDTHGNQDAPTKITSDNSLKCASPVRTFAWFIRAVA